jgi:hypothetical protein
MPMKDSNDPEYPEHQDLYDDSYIPAPSWGGSRSLFRRDDEEHDQQLRHLTRIENRLDDISIELDLAKRQNMQILTELHNMSALIAEMTKPQKPAEKEPNTTENRFSKLDL